MIDIKLKQELGTVLEKIIEDRIHHSLTEMKEVQQAANAEEKNTSGDKYETARAMAQIERDKAARQYQEALKLKAVFNSLSFNSINSSISLSSLIETERQLFFFGLPLGAVKVNDCEVMCISQASPVGQLLFNKKAGDVVRFGKIQHTIMNVI